jgi:peroxiredoxin Q/BCP
MSEPRRLEVGDLAPPFCLPNQRGEQVCLEDLRPKPAILYFYPKDMTPGCTLEATGFNAVVDEIAALGWRVVGISPDTVASHARFAERHSLRFDILADPEREILRAYGAWGTKVSYGKHIEGVIRSTILVDGDGRVTAALYNVRAAGHVERVMRIVREQAQRTEAES